MNAKFAQLRAETLKLNRHIGLRAALNPFAMALGFMFSNPVLADGKWWSRRAELSIPYLLLVGAICFWSSVSHAAPEDEFMKAVDAALCRTEETKGINLNGHGFNVKPATFLLNDSQQHPLIRVMGDMSHRLRFRFDDKITYAIPYENGMPKEPHKSIKSGGFIPILDIVKSLTGDVIEYTFEGVKVKPPSVYEAARKLADLLSPLGWQQQVDGVIALVAAAATDPLWCVDRATRPFPPFYVVAKHSGKCLHQHGATQGNGDPITQWACVNQPNVKLEVIRASGFHFLRFKHSGKCVHQHGATQGDGDAITQWACVNQPNVKLSLEPKGGGFYFLKFPHSGKCVHQHGATQGDGDPITQWECVDQPNVLWKFIPAPN